MVPVIYKIVNRQTKKKYIGSAINYKQRWSIHLTLLKQNQHHSRHLQSSFNKYGEHSFIFMVIEVVKNTDKLLEREQYWMDYYQSHNDGFGYNICPKSKSPLGVKHSLETKNQTSKNMKRLWGNAEFRKKMAKSNNDPKLLETRVEYAKKQWDDPDIKRKMVDAMRKTYSEKTRKPLVTTQELRSKMSDHTKRNWADPLVREKRISGLKGKIRSLEHCLKLSTVQKGRKFSQEHKNKISQSLKGKKPSIETIEKRKKTILNRKKER